MARFRNSNNQSAMGTVAKEEPDDGTRRGQSVSARYPNDQKLRKAGYAIHSRPKKGPVLWEKNHVPVTQAEALASVDKAIAEAHQNLADALLAEPVGGPKV